MRFNTFAIYGFILLRDDGFLVIYKVDFYGLQAALTQAYCSPTGRGKLHVPAQSTFLNYNYYKGTASYLWSLSSRFNLSLTLPVGQFTGSILLFFYVIAVG
ncbi:hypothetical protein GDO78_010325 [Eleutherodactylus coqui]|uniref:Uncharacterized protein n=1 Tax=Eleutherodactylus coqui TaxID=57060 RepID=A0A8J6F5A2_ELECQ|nr:hypothetical protein GDO78_010325 [Eleutherodactylus coqui]